MFLQTKPWAFYQFNDPNIQNITQKNKLNSKKHKDTGTANESQAKEKGRRHSKQRERIKTKDYVRVEQFHELKETAYIDKQKWVKWAKGRGEEHRKECNEGNFGEKESRAGDGVEWERVPVKSGELGEF